MKLISLFFLCTLIGAVVGQCYRECGEHGRCVDDGLSMCMCDHGWTTSKGSVCGTESKCWSDYQPCDKKTSKSS
jgi:hypothetical protein